MRVLVCGGRNYSGREAVFAELDALLSENGHLVVIQGGGAGADFFAREWVKQAGAGVVLVDERARWRDLSCTDAVIKVGKYGRYDAMAGPRRNEKMIRDHRPDLVLAFPGGSGTADVVGRAERAGVPVRRCGQ